MPMTYEQRRDAARFAERIQGRVHAVCGGLKGKRAASEALALFIGAAFAWEASGHTALAQWAGTVGSLIISIRGASELPGIIAGLRGDGTQEENKPD